jgi:hypothetical protein
MWVRYSRESVLLIVGNRRPVWQRTIPSVLHQTEKPPLRAVERAICGAARRGQEAAKADFASALRQKPRKKHENLVKRVA